MGASASELAEAPHCVLSVHFMFDRDDFIYKLVNDDYMELLNSVDIDDIKGIEKENICKLRNKKRIVFSSEVPFSQLPQIEGWFRNTTAPECVLIALLQHFNWLITNLDINSKNNKNEIIMKETNDTFSIDYNKYIAKGRNFDGYNIEMITINERIDLKNSFDKIEFVMDNEIHNKLDKLNIPIQEQCWEDEIWIGNARDNDEWLQFLETRFENDEIHLRCIIKTDEMEPNFFIKFINRIMCHEGANIIFNKDKINQVKEWDYINDNNNNDNINNDIHDEKNEKDEKLEKNHKKDTRNKKNKKNEKNKTDTIQIGETTNK